MTTKDFLRRNLGPWANAVLRRGKAVIAGVFESFVAGQAPDGVAVSERS